MNRKQISVNVFHPNTQHSFQLALALEKANFLNKFVTSIYYKPAQFPYHWLSGLAVSPAEKFTKEFKRRFLEGLNPEKIDQYPWFEVWRLLAEKAGISKRMGEKLLHLCEDRIDSYVSRKYLDHILAVVGFGDCSVRTFRAAKKKNILRVLDQAIIHIDSASQLLQEEAACCPDFAETIDYGLQDEKWRDERREETILADAILCGSEFSKKSVIKAGISPEKVFVIPYGVNLNRFPVKQFPEKKASGKKMRILFQGSVGQRKGIKYLLEAVKQLDHPNFELILVGNFVGSREPFKPYEKWFRHVPRVSNENLPNSYASADVLILPSIVDGFGIVVLEAMASGVPVIVSENTCAGDLVENGKDGFVIPIRNVEAIKEKLLFFYEHQDKISEMGHNARVKAKKFSWVHYQSNIKNVFDKLLTKGLA